MRARGTPRSGFHFPASPWPWVDAQPGLCGLRDAQWVQALVRPNQWFSSLSFFFFLSVIKQFIDPKEKYRERERSETMSTAW